MLDRLIDFILSSLRAFQFLEVIDAYQQAVVLRFGKYHRTLDPGLHVIWPFYIERVLADNVVPTLRALSPQSLTTRDGVSVVVQAISTFRTNDIRKLLLEIEGAETVTADATLGIIGREVRGADFNDLLSEEFAERVTKAVRKKAWQYGIEVMAIQFSDVSKARSLRLWHEGNR